MSLVSLGGEVMSEDGVKVFLASENVMEEMIETKNEVKSGVYKKWRTTGKENGIGEAVKGAYLGEIGAIGYTHEAK